MTKPVETIEGVGSLHAVLHSAYAEILSDAVNRSLAPITLDHLVQEHIKTLKAGEKRELVSANGAKTGYRASRWDRLVDLEERLTKVVAAIKEAEGNPDALRSIGIYEADMSTMSEQETQDANDPDGENSGADLQVEARNLLSGGDAT